MDGCDVWRPNNGLVDQQRPSKQMFELLSQVSCTALSRIFWHEWARLGDNGTYASQRIPAALPAMYAGPVGV